MADAWFLKIGAGNTGQVITTPSAWLTAVSGNSFEIEFKIQRTSGNIAALTSSDAFGLTVNVTNVQIPLTGTANAVLAHGVNSSDLNTYRITYDGNTTSLFMNGATTATASVVSGVTAGINLSDISSSGGRQAYNLYYLKTSLNGVAFTHFNPTLSGGSGLVLSNSVDSNNNGALNSSYPTDGSQWELYQDTGGGDTILPTGVPTEEAFGTPAIDTNSVDVAPTSIPSETAFGTPSLTGAAVLTPSGIPSETSTGSPAITTGEVYIEPEGIPSLEAFGLPTVSVGVLFITPIGLASAEELGTPEIKLFVQYITPTGIQTAEVLGRPSISGGDEPTFYLTNQGVKYKVNGAILISITNE